MNAPGPFAASGPTGAFCAPAPLILLISLAAGVSFAFAASVSHAALYAIGAALLVALLFFPEFALALYVVAGDVKGDERVAALLPFDWTVAVGVMLVAGILLNLLRGRRALTMPPVYFLLGALVMWMAASLIYTPNFAAGMDKLERFLAVTGLVIVAPFFVLGTPAAMKRFLLAFGAAAFAICGYALHGLGGDGRLVSPSDNTIGLGHVACALVLLIWFGGIPRDRWTLRLFFYGLIAVPAVALLGSGARGSVVACALAIAISLFLSRRRFFDFALLAGCGLCALPFLRIPQSSFDYLATLVRPGGLGELLDFRSDLLGYAWRLIEAHPLIGAGLEGFAYSSPNPGVYKWPHNIFLEVACELGIPAALLMLGFFGAAARVAWRELRQAGSQAGAFALLTAAWLLLGIVNGLNTGDINSDRTTWLFASLVFVAAGYAKTGPEPPSGDRPLRWEGTA